MKKLQIAIAILEKLIIRLHLNYFAFWGAPIIFLSTVELLRLENASVLATSNNNFYARGAMRHKGHMPHMNQIIALGVYALPLSILLIK